MYGYYTWWSYLWISPDGKKVKNLILDLVSFQKLSYDLSVENFFLKLCDCLPTFMFYDKVSCLS